MALPDDPGLYRDAIGHLWLLEDDHRWMHAARRRNDGSLTPVMGQFTGRMTPAQFEHLATGPNANVLPLERIETANAPAEI